jgi:hypothetical protein
MPFRDKPDGPGEIQGIEETGGKYSFFAAKMGFLPHFPGFPLNLYLQEFRKVRTTPQEERRK